MYKPEYLEAAFQDMQEIADYITNSLANPEAADRLIKNIVESVINVCDFPYMYPVYFPLRKLSREYRKFSVKNYLVFYFVDEEKKLVCVARVMYARRDFEKMH